FLTGWILKNILCIGSRKICRKKFRLILRKRSCQFYVNAKLNCIITDDPSSYTYRPDFLKKFKKTFLKNVEVRDITGPQQQISDIYISIDDTLILWKVPPKVWVDEGTRPKVMFPKCYKDTFGEGCPLLQERRSTHKSNVFVINMNKVNTRGKNTLIGARILLFVITKMRTGIASHLTPPALKEDSNAK
ncbi:hypothetical protein L9F63_016338, partial [Diploptera punctata]